MFLFTHVATDMVKTFSGDEFRTSASSNDVLNPATAYTLYIYQQNKVVYTHNFTTATFATASTRTPSTIERLNGGLLSSSSSPAPLVIEYKTNEFLFIPYSYLSAGDPSIAYTFNSTDVLSCQTNTLRCFPNSEYVIGFIETLSSRVTFIGVLQPPKAPDLINQVANGRIRYYYNVRLITE